MYLKIKISIILPFIVLFLLIACGNIKDTNASHSKFLYQDINYTCERHEMYEGVDRLHEKLRDAFNNLNGKELSALQKDSAKQTLKAFFSSLEEETTICISGKKTTYLLVSDFLNIVDTSHSTFTLKSISTIKLRTAEMNSQRSEDVLTLWEPFYSPDFSPMLARKNTYFDVTGKPTLRFMKHQALDSLLHTSSNCPILINGISLKKTSFQ